MLILFVIFTISEKLTHRKGHKGLEQFNLEVCSDVENQKVGARPGCVLVAVRDFNRLTHLASVLQKTNTRKHDIVAVAVRNVSTGAGEYDLSASQLFTHYEQELFSRVVALAEKEGKTVELLVVPGIDAFDALVQTAAKLHASRLVTGVSARMDSGELARRIGKAWQKLPEPRLAFSLEIISRDRPTVFVNLGPHPPRLWPEDVDTVHSLWLDLSEEFGSKIHHRDIVGVALRRMVRDMNSGLRDEVARDVTQELTQRHTEEKSTVS
jgi:nucleotide-binding universal stress UspA family protein